MGLATDAVFCIFICMCTVARIFIDGHSLHIKRAVPIGLVRLLRKFKQRTNVPYLYHYKKTLTILCTKKLMRTVLHLRALPYFHPWS